MKGILKNQPLWVGLIYKLKYNYLFESKANKPSFNNAKIDFAKTHLLSNGRVTRTNWSEQSERECKKYKNVKQRQSK